MSVGCAHKCSENKPRPKGPMWCEISIHLFFSIPFVPMNVNLFLHLLLSKIIDNETMKIQNIKLLRPKGTAEMCSVKPKSVGVSLKIPLTETPLRKNTVCVFPSWIESEPSQLNKPDLMLIFSREKEKHCLNFPEEIIDKHPPQR